MDTLLPTMQRQEIIATALRTRGALIQCADLDEAAAASIAKAKQMIDEQGDRVFR